MRYTGIFLMAMLALFVMMTSPAVDAQDEDCPALIVATPAEGEGADLSDEIALPDLSATSAASDCLSEETTAEATPDALLPGWSLLWSDEFHGPAGSPINADDWTCETGGQGWGNKELEYYTDLTDNVALDGQGFLQITAQTGPPADGETCWYGQCAYTSARCITYDKVEFTYGRVEARLQIPFGQGIWPAFWMLGANFSQVGWPGSGEIDIMENIGSEPQTVHGTIHGPGYSGAGGIGDSYAIDADFAEDFHVFAIEWEPDVIRWYVDGEQFNTLTADDLGSRRWVFDHDFFIIMNVAVGGSWPGYPDESSTFPQHMRVDYVRVYQPAE